MLCKTFPTFSLKRLFETHFHVKNILLLKRPFLQLKHKQLYTFQGQPKDVLVPHLHHLPENKGRQGWIYQVHVSGFPLITPLRLHVVRDLMRCFLFKTSDGMFFPWKTVSKVESDEQRHVSAYSEHSADSLSARTTKKNGLVAKQTESDIQWELADE